MTDKDVRNMQKDLENREGQSGFTLVELMVVVGISVVVLAAVVGLFVTTNEIYTVQDQMVRIQQGVRNNLSRLTNDIRMAGLNPTGNADCAGIAVANATRLHVLYDYNEDGTCDPVDRDYQYNAAERQLEVQRGGGGGYQAISRNVNSVAFSYLMSDGTTQTSTTSFQDIENVQIRICGKISGGYAEDYNGTSCFSTSVQPRNIGLGT